MEETDAEHIEGEMKCEQCLKIKSKQTYQDVCDACANRAVVKLWEDVLPLMRSFCDQIKTGSHGEDE